jgi:hypothetical protein
MVDRVDIQRIRANRHLILSTRRTHTQNALDRQLQLASHVTRVSRRHGRQLFERQVSSSLFSIFILINRWSRVGVHQ